MNHRILEIPATTRGTLWSIALAVRSIFGRRCVHAGAAPRKRSAAGRNSAKTLACKLALLAGGLAVCTSAHAWFFFFIPGGLTRGISDAITGAKGNICVKEGAKAGDVLTSANGNTAKVLSVSGTSSICPTSELPIRAELQFSINYSSKAGIELPDDFESKPLNDVERFNGTLLKAASKSKSSVGVVVSSVVKRENMDLQTLANTIEGRSLKNPRFKEVRSQNPEQITVNGVSAVRWEIVATLKGIFGPDATYFHTLYAGDTEMLLVNIYSPTKAFAEHKAEYVKIAEAVRGIHAAEGEAPLADAPKNLPALPPPAVANEALPTADAAPAGAQAAPSTVPAGPATTPAAPSTAPAAPSTAPAVDQGGSAGKESTDAKAQTEVPEKKD